MIDVDKTKSTYVCPYCGCKQAYSSDCCEIFYTGYRRGWSSGRKPEDKAWDVDLYYIKCNNKKCNKMTVVAISDNADSKQWDIFPENVHKQYPEYIPEQIRDDYVEACSIINSSPKAAATLLRRCLQGMIHDFWNQGASIF